jgi:hypothetical protein
MTQRIFLSASVPDPARHPRYHETADRTAIRDAVRALATVVIPKCHLVWGGHPAITPLIAEVLSAVSPDSVARVTLFQSSFFERVFHIENGAFNNVVYVNAIDDNRELSLRAMRDEMLTSAKFSAGVFIGGMEGVEEEYDLFRLHQPDAVVLPIASSGAAAEILYRRYEQNLPKALTSDLAYPSLFRTLLKL